MHRRARLASLLWVLAIAGSSGCSSEGGTPSWIASVRAVCIRVEQSYTSVPGHEEPIAETVAQVLGGMGIAARPGEGPDCPTALVLTLQMTPEAKHYSGAPEDCYTDVHGGGRVTLTSPPGTARYRLDVERIGGPIITRCPTAPVDAPFDAAWGEALVPWLEAWWGAPGLDSALVHGNWAMRAEAARRLGVEPTEPGSTHPTTAPSATEPTALTVPPEEPVPGG